jgi:hypothetical protein
MSEYKYQLDKSSKKHLCPGCGRKTFVAFQVSATKEYVDETRYGRCDRDNNCVYFLSPWSDNSSYDTVVTPTTPAPVIEPAVIKPNESYVSGWLFSPQDNFSRGLRKIGAEPGFLNSWGVGSMNRYTVFIIQDGTGPINAKFIPYNTELKRLKGKYDYPFYLGKSYIQSEGLLKGSELDDWQDYYKFERCFFGEHLFEPSKDTLVVESEKSAVIGAFFLPQWNWLATGGNSGLTFSQFSLFTGYRGRIYNLVDNDEAGYEKSKTVQWLHRLAEMREDTTSIASLNLFKHRPTGWDIADELLANPDFAKQGFNQALKVAKPVYRNCPEVVTAAADDVKRYEAKYRLAYDAIRQNINYLERRANYLRRLSNPTAAKLEELRSINELIEQIDKFTHASAQVVSFALKSQQDANRAASELRARVAALKATIGLLTNGEG